MFLDNQLNINDLYNHEVVTVSSLKMGNSYIQLTIAVKSFKQYLALQD